MDVPDVRYARAGGVAIAYQVVGDGPRTLVFSPQVSDLFTIWLSRRTRLFLERLAAETRLVILNPRGTGLSDRPRSVTLEARMDDITSVLDHVDVQRASLIGISTSANVCALFAATYPERVDRLILIHPSPRGIRSDDYPWGLDEEEWLAWTRDVRAHWGDRAFQEKMARDVDPAIAADPRELELYVWTNRLALAPGAAADWTRLGMETDIVDVLGAIRVPTLVLHRVAGESGRIRSYSGTGSLEFPSASEFSGAETARFVTERIRDSSAVPLRAEHSSAFSQEAAEAVLEFLRGHTPEVVPDSVLATVLFTDLVGSTQRAARLGDRAWRDLLVRHHTDVRTALARYRGDEVDSAGDGFFCRFDGPARAIACARSIVGSARELDLEVRAGVHIGECELVREKIAGIAVVTGSRISALAAPGEVLVSGTVKDLVAGSGFTFEERGEHELKGVPGTWRLYAVVDG